MAQSTQEILNRAFDSSTNTLNASVADGSITAAKLDSAALESLYPVGSIYMNAGVATNPNTLLGFGTWAAFGEGRVAVGFDDGGDTDFDTLEEEGGVKTHALSAGELAAHTHTTGVQTIQDTGSGVTALISGGGATETDSTGDGTAHTNVQPYVVVAMWQRTE